MLQKFLIFLLFTLCIFTFAQEVTEKELDTLKTKIDNLVVPHIENNWHKGIAIGVYQKGKENQIYFYGQADKDKVVDQNTIFEIGSITKTFTAILLADMIKKEVVSLEDTIDKFMPYSLEHEGQKVTLEHLVTHTSGLPSLPGNFAPKNPENPYEDYTEEQMDAFLSEYQLQRKPGEQYEYSNLAMGLLGRILALKAQKTYEDMLQEIILSPLSMNTTYITVAEKNIASFAKGHTADGNMVSHWDLPAFNSAGAIDSNTIDMLKFVEANIDAYIATEKNNLQQAMVTVQQKRKDIAPNMGIGMGWHILKDEIVCHDGGTGGFCSFLAFDPEKQLGMVILSNSAISVTNIGINIIKLLRNDEVKVAPVRKSIVIDEKILDDYKGQYQLGFMAIDIFVENGKLMAQASNQPKFRIYPESETMFFYKVVDAQVEFVRDANGEIDRLILHQLGQKLSVLKIK